MATTTTTTLTGFSGLNQTELETTQNLPALVLSHYRTIFYANIATGQARYFVLPYCLLGSNILPVIYLTIPHKNRPWLYQARWAVAALMAGLNYDLLTNGTSSANPAMGYCTGLVACWGLIWGLTVLLVLDPQFEAARVMKRRKRRRRTTTITNGSASPSNDDNLSNGGVDTGRAMGDQKAASSAIDASVARVQEEYEHYWQYYPAEGSLLDRLGWAIDISFALRGVGE